MLEKMKNRMLSLNLKKSVLILVIVGLIFGIGSGIAVYQNFGNRIAQVAEYQWQQREEWLQGLEQYSQETEDQSLMSAWGRHDHDDRYENRNYQGWGARSWNRNYLDNGWAQSWNLSTGDRVLIGVLFGIGALLGAAYWLLCMVWAYQKANKLGSNRRLWVIATFFFNLWAIAALYVYSFVRGTCKNCGRLKKKGEKYCSHCGTVCEQECSHCHAPVQKDSKFCPNCGEVLEKE